MNLNMRNSNGVIYYNIGTPCLVRLLVSIYSLRKFYKGPISILSWGQESHKICKLIASATNSDVIEINPKMAPSKYPHYMAKTKLHEFSPYINTLYLDSDTLIVGNINNLFDLISQHQMLVTYIEGWPTNRGKMSKRIKSWAPFHPKLIGPALEYGKAINCGVFGFNRKAIILRKWYKLAITNPDYLMPDELSLQLLLPHYQHIAVDNSYNFITKRGNVNDSRIKILHYQSRKHCKPSADNKWLITYLEVAAKNIANVKLWQPAGDRKLARYLKHA